MSIMNFFGIKKALYFPGCITELLLKDIKDNYKSILSDLKIDYSANPPFQCCGAPLLNAGYKEEFTQLVNKNKELLKRQGFSKIIVNCPHCYHLFKKYYGIPVEHITQLLSKNLNKISRKNRADISYFDACYLGKKSGVFEEPRNAIKTAGYLIREQKNNRENAFCCGAGGLMKAANPGLADSTAQAALTMFRTKEIVVPCPLCYLHLKENAKEHNIKELSELFVEI
jgi:heterodisulfide reductase subunit D